MESVKPLFFKSKCKRIDFKFIPPPEAPLFEPTLEEFQDPIAYINSIKPIAEQTGICKIKPPPEWEPPFALDIEKFKFTPRLQRLNELEAKTRIKLNFLDQIAKFWDLQGCPLKLPLVERRTLDMYALHQLVKEEGGFNAVTHKKKWTDIAERMGFINHKGAGTLIRTHYERMLYPFDVFKERELSEKMIQNEKANGQIVDRIKVEKEDCEVEEAKVVPTLNPSPLKAPLETPNHTASCKDPPKTETKELRYYGKSQVRREFITFDPLAKYICKNCQRGDVEESMLLCDGCDDSYHTFCLMPPLAEVPKGDWRCPKCIANEVKKPAEAFGFEQAQREYTLHQFGEMADRFKANYFSMPVHRVPTTLVENEFWRLVSSIDEDVCVEYGADLHSVEHGSGFPTKKTSNLDEDPSLKTYVESGWNLNNIPILEDSVLSFINADISGMKVPWMYVGMCFSTFCWHNEDHWSYSINYLHWGEPKTWYGVPGSHADVFERSMKMAAPELFEHQPDLLHQLVTILNPNVLMSEGVPVCRTDQQAGEFVITFPRAYHAGFNQGYNFAEAVNFAPVDWLKIGRECINYYSSLRRHCVFSHDELVCKMAMDAENLNPRTAAATYDDVLVMVEFEKKLRKSLLDWGVCEAEREAFELLPDDERQCDVCKTTCFLSAVTCSCPTSRLVCLRHYDHCGCPPKNHVLRYRYTLDEMPVMLQRLKARADSYSTWIASAEECLSKPQTNRLDLIGLKKLIAQAEESKFPFCKLLYDLKEVDNEASKCSSVANEILNNKHNYKICENGCRLTLEELDIFYDKLKSLPCDVPELEGMRIWLEGSMAIKEKTLNLIRTDSTDVGQLAECWLFGMHNGLETSDVEKLVPHIETASWINWAQEAVTGKRKYTMMDIRSILIEAEEIPVTNRTEELSKQLNELLLSAKRWEEQAKQAINKPRCNQKVDYFEELLVEGETMNVLLPSLGPLSDKLKHMKSLVAEAEEVLESKRKFKVKEIKELVKKIQPLPIASQFLSNLQKRISDTDAWIKEAGELFLKDHKMSLLQVLCPVLDDRVNCKKVGTNDFEVQSDSILQLVNDIKSGIPPEELLKLNMAARDEQIKNMKSIQLFNIRKKINAKRTTEFCVCKKKLQGLMYECSLCREWFHDTCVPIVKDLVNSYDKYGFDINFICGLCCKSKRPTQMDAIKLLLKLERLRIIIPEGEALKLLFERALVYQLKFREILKNEEIRDAISKLGASKNENIGKDFCFEDELDTQIKWKILGNTEIKDTATSQCQMLSKYYIDLDHNYTLGSNHSDITKKHIRKSPLGTRDCGEEDDNILPITLGKNLVLILKELFNQGGTVELSLKENQIIWRLLQASVPHKVHKDFGIYKFPSKMSQPIQNEPEPKKTKKQIAIEPANLKKRKSSKIDDTEKIEDKGATIKGEESPDKTEKRKKVKVEACASSSCSKPMGTKIDWVQCDGKCNGWFHMRCVGLDKKSLKKDDDYYCPECVIVQN